MKCEQALKIDPCQYSLGKARCKKDEIWSLCKITKHIKLLGNNHKDLEWPSIA